MKKTVLSGILLTLLFILPALLKAESLPEVKTYDDLRHAISEARAQSRSRVEKAVEKERVREAWEIGRLIDAHVLQHKERADYAKQVLPRLAQDLGMSQSELYRMLEFYRAYPIFAHARKLSWSEYRDLLAVNDPEKREALAERTEKEGWTRDRLRKEVKALKGTPGEDSEDEELLPPSEPGKPGTYKIILAKTGPYADELAIDLGFSNYIQLSKIVKDESPFNEGEVVALSDEQGEIRKAGAEGLYTYWAWVHRVLDGDTLEAVVDLGFGITTTQTLRLRGIDAPEIETADGMEAKEFVEKMFAPSSRVLIKTVKSDKYDRYLADVFLPARSLKASAGGTGATRPEGNTGKTGKQVYLNNLLLEKGHAVRVRE